MSQLSDIVQITISRTTQSVATANFGTPGIISEFLTSKTTTPFERYREYASLTEMTDDGWATTDEVYRAAQAIFQQNPTVEKVMVGRKDAADASWAVALAAIQAASTDWYCFVIVRQILKIVWDADFVTGNAIDIDINGTTITTVNYATSHVNTMGLIETQIEADLADSTATIDPDDANSRTMLVEIDGSDVIPTGTTVAVTGGASQADETLYFETGEQDVKDVAAWTETQKKIFFNSSGDLEILDSGVSDDIASFLQNLDYDRTVTIYYPHSAAHTWIEAAWLGECLPYDPGSQTWMFKTLTGVAAYEITSSQRTTTLGKDCNIYTETASISMTEEGKVASTEYIDIIRGIDWLEATMSENIFSELVNTRKIPFTDEGATSIEGIVKGALDEAVQNDLISDDYTTDVPLIADVSSANKLARSLPDVEFTATLQGAIHNVVINGVVSV